MESEAAEVVADSAGSRLEETVGRIRFAEARVAELDERAATALERAEMAAAVATVAAAAVTMAAKRLEAVQTATDSSISSVVVKEIKLSTGLCDGSQRSVSDVDQESIQALASLLSADKGNVLL